MIWTTASSRPYFCWLYRASPSLATKNIINLILVLTILVISLCRVMSCVVGKGCLLWPLCSLDKTLPALLHFVLQDQTYLLLCISLDFIPLHCNPLWWKGHFFFFLVLDLESVVVFHRTGELQFLWHSGWGIDFDYCDIEWFVLEINWDHTGIFKIALSTAFWRFLLTMRSTPFLLRDSCPQ